MTLFLWLLIFCGPFLVVGPQALIVAISAGELSLADMAAAVLDTVNVLLVACGPFVMVFSVQALAEQRVARGAADLPLAEPDLSARGPDPASHRRPDPAFVRAAQ
jgi:hypothetical protein